MIPFVFRKNVKTRTKTGYRIIIFLGNVLSISLCSAHSLIPSFSEILSIHSFYSLIAIHLSCQLCRCYYLYLSAVIPLICILIDTIVTTIISPCLLQRIMWNSRWLFIVAPRVNADCNHESIMNIKKGSYFKINDFNRALFRESERLISKTFTPLCVTNYKYILQIHNFFFFF